MPRKKSDAPERERHGMNIEWGPSREDDILTVLRWLVIHTQVPKPPHVKQALDRLVK